jgi:hypothetical protein
MKPTDVPPAVTVPIKVRIHQIDRLRSEARRRGVRADELASEILANVVADDLFAAVVDH